MRLGDSHINHSDQLSTFYKKEKKNSVELKGPHVNNKYVHQLRDNNNKLVIILFN